MRLLVLVIAVAGCGLDPMKQRRPVRFTGGVAVHRLPAADRDVAYRSQQIDDAEPSNTAVTGSWQLTTATRRQFFVGAELELGKVGDGTHAAGAFAILGAERSSNLGVLAVEVASGLRATRVDTVIVEPRVRGHLWLSPRVTLGAAAGAPLDGGWMAGVYLGVYSTPFGAFKPCDPRYLEQGCP